MKGKGKRAVSFIGIDVSKPFLDLSVTPGGIDRTLANDRLDIKSCVCFARKISMGACAAQLR